MACPRGSVSTCIALADRDERSMRQSRFPIPHAAWGIRQASEPLAGIRRERACPLRIADRDQCRREEQSLLGEHGRVGLL